MQLNPIRCPDWKVGNSTSGNGNVVSLPSDYEEILICASVTGDDYNNATWYFPRNEVENMGGNKIFTARGNNSQILSILINPNVYAIFGATDQSGVDEVTNATARLYYR